MLSQNRSNAVLTDCEQLCELWITAGQRNGKDNVSPEWYKLQTTQEFLLYCDIKSSEDENQSMTENSNSIIL